MEAKDVPRLITSEEEAKAEGKRMAGETIKKLKPQTKGITQVINEANNRIYESGRKAGMQEVVDTYKRENPSHYRKYRAYWQAKLKEWGL